MPPIGFELPIQPRERPQTHALDPTATRIGVAIIGIIIIIIIIIIWWYQ